VTRTPEAFIRNAVGSSLLYISNQQFRNLSKAEEKPSSRPSLPPTRPAALGIRSALCHVRGASTIKAKDCERAKRRTAEARRNKDTRRDEWAVGFLWGEEEKEEDEEEGWARGGRSGSRIVRVGALS
jgi:hypothetical protein